MRRFIDSGSASLSLLSSAEPLRVSCFHLFLYISSPSLFSLLFTAAEVHMRLQMYETGKSIFESIKVQMFFSLLRHIEKIKSSRPNTFKCDINNRKKHVCCYTWRCCFRGIPGNCFSFLCFNVIMKLIFVFTIYIHGWIHNTCLSAVGDR